MVPKPLYEAGLMRKWKWEEKSFTSYVPIASHYIFLLHHYICWRVANADEGGIELFFKQKYWMYWVPATAMMAFLKSKVACNTLILSVCNDLK